MSLTGYSTPETLTDDAGNALKGITVAVTGPGSYSGTATTDSTSGILRLGPLPIGDYTITYQGRTAVVPVLATSTDLQTAYDNAAAAETPAGAQAKADAALAAAEANAVPLTRTVAGKPLSADVTLVKGDVGLGSVDNTADAAKPISTAAQTALDLKAPLASPAFTGTPSKGGSPLVTAADVAGAYPLVGSTSQAWAPATVYALNDVRIYAGGAQRCIVPHTSGATFDSNNWEPWAPNAAAVIAPRPIGHAKHTLLTAFQSGHGWTASAGTLTNDTSVFAFGSASAKLVTAGTGAASRLDSPALTSFDLTKYSIAVLVRISDVTKVSQLTARIGSGAAAAYQVTMYSSTAVQPQIRSGEWGWLTFDAANVTTIGAPPAKTAITYIGLQVTDIGSSNPVTINWNAVKLIPKPSTIFPNGVVSLSFDDGFLEQFTIAKPILDLKGYSATAYVINDLIAATRGTYMSLQDLYDLQNNSGWEIAAHAARLADHNLSGAFSDLTAAQMDAECRDMLAWFADKGFPIPTNMAYPQGKHNATVRAAVQKYFTIGRTIDYFPSIAEMMPPLRPTEVRCRPLDQLTSTATYTGLIDEAYANGDWLQLYTHKVVASGATGTQINTANFQTVVDYLATKGIPVLPVGQVLQMLAAGRP